jgi:hypothetical protein
MSKSKWVVGLLTCAGLAWTGAAGAAPISKDEYKAANARIEATYKADKDACAGLTGNAKDVCIEKARAKEKVAKADNEAAYKNTRQARYDAQVARAEADYAVAKEKCDDLSGDRKDACVKEAQAAEAKAKADAKSAQVSGNATRTAARKTEAHDDVAADKRERGYRAAVEKCDSLSGDAKDACIRRAKAKYGM